MKTISYLSFVFLTMFVIYGCGTKKVELSGGKWRGVVKLIKEDSGSEMPFIFDLTKKSDSQYEMTIYNADEKIFINEITRTNDSLIIRLPVFKDEIHAAIITKDSLSGDYYHQGSRSKYTMPFFASAGNTERFPISSNQTPPNLDGRWETTIDPGDSNSTKYIAQFSQNGNKITGTFLTSAGDYRYLDGVVDGNKLLMSTLDGNHSLLVKADITSDGKLDNGLIIGGPTWKEKFIAVKNEKFELPKADTITKLKPGITKIDFTFTDLQNNRVSLSDDKYKNKPVIIQIMGSWCPNCMDETKLFSELYDKYSPQGLRIIGLCFESNDFEESKKRIERFKTQLNANYDFLYAGEVGKSVKESLPFIEKLNGYPTTLYLDKDHNVKKIYTGFSGPGTGEEYIKLKNEIIKTIEGLL